jgi:hypothetical protein
MIEPSINAHEIKHFNRLKIFVTGTVLLFVLSLLLWQYFHSCVPSHHVLQNGDLPGISNWWNALILPVLTWLSLNRIKKRLDKANQNAQSYQNAINNITLRFMIALCLGGTLAFAFAYDYKLFLDNIPYLLLILALLMPIYFSEFILGFVLAMTYTLGAVLPLVFIFIFSGLGFLLFKLTKFVMSKLQKNKSAL